MIELILQDSLLLTFSIVILGSLIIFYIYLLSLTKKSNAYIKKFKLYELRDRLRMEAALGRIDPQSDFFKFYDDLFCKFLKKTEMLSMYQLAKVMKQKKSDVLNNPSKEIQKICEELKSSPKEIQEIITELYFEVFKLLFTQSKGFCAIMIIHTLSHLIVKHLRILKEEIYLQSTIGINSLIIFTSVSNNLNLQIKQKNNSIATNVFFKMTSNQKILSSIGL